MYGFCHKRNFLSPAAARSSWASWRLFYPLSSFDPLNSGFNGLNGSLNHKIGLPIGKPYFIAVAITQSVPNALKIVFTCLGVYRFTYSPISLW